LQLFEQHAARFEIGNEAASLGTLAARTLIRISQPLTLIRAWHSRAGLREDEGRTVPQLSPRLRTVFVMLFEGHDRKRIAHLLGISQHTAKDYISEVYRHFGVSSQVELIRRFALGDGKDEARAG
jgi:DNA-binding NarL/FixJ family response regulator